MLLEVLHRGLALMGTVRRNQTQIREAKVEPEDKHERADDHLETVSLPESEPTYTDQPAEPAPEREHGPTSTLRQDLGTLLWTKIIVLSVTFIFQKRKSVAPCNCRLHTRTARTTMQLA